MAKNLGISLKFNYVAKQWIGYKTLLKALTFMYELLTLGLKYLTGHKMYQYPHPMSSDMTLITPVEEKSE
jgi:hypothetical protein